MAKIISFKESLKESHRVEQSPMWEEIYRQAFPNFAAMVAHPENGDHQKLGVDRSVILKNSKQILIDEKFRHKDYKDIALEFWSNKEAGIRGWVCKDLMCDYIAYAILETKECYLLPVLQLREAWVRHHKKWFKKYPKRATRTHRKNPKGGGEAYYTTEFLCVPLHEVYKEMVSTLRSEFSLDGEAE